MPAKKSNPDAKIGSVVPIGHAVNFTGKKSNNELKVERLHEAVNQSGGGKAGGNMKSIDGTKEPKCDVCIPSVKDMNRKVNKQFAENEKVNKKYRGD